MAADRIVLDSGALTAIAEASSRPAQATRTLVRQALESGGSVVVPTVVVAESVTGSGPRDSRVNRLLKGVLVEPLDEPMARAAAALRYATKAGVADAIVVATADAEPHSVILTGDPADIRRLAAVRNLSRVAAFRT